MAEHTNGFGPKAETARTGPLAGFQEISDSKYDDLFRVLSEIQNVQPRPSDQPKTEVASQNPEVLARTALLAGVQEISNSNPSEGTSPVAAVDWPRPYENVFRLLSEIQSVQPAEPKDQPKTELASRNLEERPPLFPSGAETLRPMVDELSEEDGRRTKWWLPTGMIVMTLVVAGVVIGLVVSKRSNAPSDYATAPQLVLPSEKVSATSQRTISVASAESPSEAQVSAGSNFGASKDEDIAPKIAPSQEAPPQAVAPSKDTPPQTSAAVAPSKEPSKDTASQSPATVAPSANSPPQTFAAVAPSENTPPQASAAVVPSQNTPPQAPAAVAPSQETSPQSSAARQSPARAIDKEELANLLERGRYLLSVGDISSARLLLERAAEAQEASAAFDLAGTYDPAVLGRSRALGIAPDLAMARLWYEKALKLGYSEAERRLARLQR